MGSIVGFLRVPLVGALLETRVGALIIASAGAAQLFAASHGFGMPCAFHETLGIPCPGCGLTRSILALGHGNVGESIAWHPYGIPAAATILLAAFSLLLPTRVRAGLIGRIAGFEQKTALSMIALMLLLPMWVIRLAHVLPFNPA